MTMSVFQNLMITFYWIMDRESEFFKFWPLKFKIGRGAPACSKPVGAYVMDHPGAPYFSCLNNGRTLKKNSDYIIIILVKHWIKSCEINIYIPFKEHSDPARSLWCRICFPLHFVLQVTCIYWMLNINIQITILFPRRLQRFVRCGAISATLNATAG